MLKKDRSSIMHRHPQSPQKRTFGFWPPLIIGVMINLSLVLTGCGGCKQIQATQEKRTHPTIQWRSGPHLQLQIPRKWVDQRIEKELRKAKLNAWCPPSFQGVQFPKLHFKIKEVHFTFPFTSPRLLSDQSNTDSRHQNGYAEIEIETRVKKQKLFKLKLKIDTPLTFNPNQQKIQLSLNSRSLKSLTLSLSKAAKKKIKKWIKTQLPKPLRTLLPKKVLNQGLREMVKLVNQEAIPTLQKELLPLLKKEVAFQWTLPKLPLRSVELKSTPKAWYILITSSLDGHGLDLESIAKSRLNTETQATLLLSSSWMTHLANWAMDHQHIPSAYTLKGKPNPQGPVRVRMEWQETAPQSPLKIHAWMNETTGGSQCFYAQVGGQLGLKMKKKKLRVKYRGKVEHLEGDLLVWLVSTLNGLTDQSMRFNTKLATPSQMTVAGQHIRWKWKELSNQRSYWQLVFNLK